MRSQINQQLNYLLIKCDFVKVNLQQNILQSFIVETETLNIVKFSYLGRMYYVEKGSKGFKMMESFCSFRMLTMLQRSLLHSLFPSICLSSELFSLCACQREKTRVKLTTYLAYIFLCLGTPAFCPTARRRPPRAKCMEQNSDFKTGPQAATHPGAWRYRRWDWLARCQYTVTA